MQIKYYPKLNPDYSKIPGRDVAFAVLLPDAYNGSKKWPWMLSLHGIGERSGGTEENLRNLVIGFDYNNDGVIDSSYVTPGMRKAVDQYGIVIVVPTYESNAFFDAGRTDWVYKQVVQNFSVTQKYWYDGFSYGGGAALNASTNPLTAPFIVYATPCAPTRSIGTISLIGQYKIVVHNFVNDEDDNGPTNLSVTKGIINDINATNPPIKAVYTAFDKFGHGSHEEATAIAPPKAPGGQGMIDAAENNYEVFLDILANGPRQMKEGAVIVNPTPPTPVPSPVKAVAEYKIDGYKIQLIGDKSTGFSQGYDGKWEFVSGPAGVTSQQVFPGGSTYINADGVLPKPGSYVFRFILKGATAPVELTVNYSGGIKSLTGFDSSTDLITYSDLTTEKGTAVLSGGKWIVKTAGGQVVNL